MEKRIGAVVILVENTNHVAKLNTIFSNHSDIIIGRLGVPLNQRELRVISLLVDGSTDKIGSLTGQIGRLDGVQVKSVLTKSQ